MGGAILMVVGLIAFSGNSNNVQAPPSQVGSVVPMSGEKNTTLTPAQEDQLARVQASEAEAARRAGRSYVPDTMLGTPEEIARAREEPDPPPPNTRTGGSYSQVQQNQQRTTGGGNNGQNAVAVPRDSILKQAEIIMNSLLAQATMQNVGIAEITAPTNPGNPPGQDNGQAPSLPGAELIGGDEIVAARLLTPIDTDITQFVLAEIAGGVLDGAQLRGQVVPMAMSGDVEDVGIRFSSMRWENRQYAIDAIALNEATATDALNGNVDRHLFTRYAMPILMAGLSGVSTYFTAIGTPSTNMASNVATGDTLIVQQERADRKDAINQGIGETADKAVQTGEKIVDRLASRPNTVRLPALTPIGVIFNAPVSAQP